MTLFSSPRPGSPRRGVTLVEMLVAVALLVLMMSVIAQVFTAATSAVSASRSYQELDQSLRQLDATIRTDLGGVTARLTPPLDPKDNLGYFEYGENSFADLQGEDADDYLRFTVKAPEGQVFYGRMWPSALPLVSLSNMTAAQLRSYLNSMPITITSRYAEVIYFLRNGNLYRRVLLVAPERQSGVRGTVPPTPGALGGAAVYANNATVSWQSMNDLSGHPSPTYMVDLSGNTVGMVLNSLGDLTNRENRPMYQRWGNDYVDNTTGVASTVTGYGDGKPDDINGDTVPDFWPSHYASLFINGPSGRGSLTPTSLINESAPPSGVTMRPGLNAEMMAFPYVFPGAYSKPDPQSAASGLGWIHTPNPAITQYSLTGLNLLNHNPLDVGDSIPPPNANDPTALQTWWGFPTWRELLAPAWTDPLSPIITTGGVQPNGLRWLDPSIVPPTFAGNAALDLLPPMTIDTIGTTTTQVRLVPQPFNDGRGTATYASVGAFTSYAGAGPDYLWKQSWEDDLIMTGVRSFDVKAYDNAFAGYVDLGWGNDVRQYVGYTPTASIGVPQFLGQTGNVIPFAFLWPPKVGSTNWPPSPLASGAGGDFIVGYNQAFDLINQTYAHEGRIPPLTIDHRPDAQFPGLNGNVGDDNTSIVRLRRVWDSWSTDYSRTPATGVNPSTGQPIGPPFTLPIYPSYPPPYPMPLRGIQITIRVVDPRNQYTKQLTIRQDFSDKL